MLIVQNIHLLIASATTSASNAASFATAAANSATAAGNSETAAGTSETNAATSATKAQNYAIKVDGAVESSNYSAKAWAIGGTGVNDTAGAGAAKNWATEADTVDGTEHSSKHMR